LLDDIDESRYFNRIEKELSSCPLVLQVAGLQPTPDGARVYPAALGYFANNQQVIHLLPFSRRVILLLTAPCFRE
jgi:hypothetical protein